MPKVIIVLIAAALFSGCAFQRPAPDADYGLPPQNYQAAIKDYFELTLKDAPSARYKFGEPERAYANNGLIYGGNVGWMGYMAQAWINAKNSYGGYTGYKPYMVFFKGDTVFKHLEGTSNVMLHRVNG